MSDQYSSSYPEDVTVSQDAVSFFQNFYRVSDTPGVDEQYVSNFTPEATFILGSKQSQGTEAIRETRRGMWSAVASRKHTVHQIYPFGSNSLEFMLRGRVEYQLKNGSSAGKDWAGHAQLVRADGGKLVFKFYQVYLDTA